MDAYLVSSSVDASDCDLLAYWSNKDKVWRRLAKVARGLLSVPASSTSSERSFSLAGNTLDDRRSRLSPEVVDSLMFLHGLK